MQVDPTIRSALQRGLVIPACPLALTMDRRLDERRQRALVRYYVAAGAGGLAVGVHTSQFAIREPHIGLFEPLLRLVAEELDCGGAGPFVRVGGVCGQTRQALAEAEFLRASGYHVALLSLAALKDATETELIAHCQQVAQVMPLMGFYLQPAVGGRVLPLSFWRRFAEIDSAAAIKIAPFNRYQTLDVVRAVTEAGRDDLALYTGNDDNIVMDLLTPFAFGSVSAPWSCRIVGGLLGQWAVWTCKAVELLKACHDLVTAGGAIPPEMVRRHVEISDANGAIFDAANGFAGCIPGVHEILRRQGLLEGIWCLDRAETLGPGQGRGDDRICHTYPHLSDDVFVRENLESWLI